MPISPHLPTEMSVPSALVPAVAREPVADTEDRAEAAGGITSAQMFHALRRRWLIALPLAAMIGALVFLGAETRLTPVYTGRTMLHVSPGRPVILYDELSERADSGNYQRTQIATVKSRIVRQAVVQTLGPLNLATFRAKDDPVGWLEKEIVADYTVAPEILRITMKGSEPDELLLILNAVRESYLREVINKDREDRVSRLNNLRDLAAKHDGTVKTQRQQLASRAETLGARDLPSLRVKYESLINRIYAMQSEALLARLEVQSTETVAPQVAPAPREEPTLESMAIETALAQGVATDTLAVGFQKEILRLEKKVSDYERRLLNYQDDLEYKQATTDLSTNRAALARRRDAIRAAVTEQLRTAARTQKPLVAGTLDPVPAAAKTPAAVKKHLALLESEIQRKEREASELSKGISELELLRNEIGSEEERLGVVNSRIRAIEVELQAPARAGVIEEAVIVETPSGSRVLKLAVAPAGVAFCGVVFLITWLDLRRGRVNGRADLEAVKIRVLGALPAVGASVLPAFALPSQDRARREYTQLTDAVDMARAVIAPILASVPGYTLVVTSAVAGEGKTVLAAHLAVRFARSGLRTLLIDTDVRRPKIDKLFGLKSDCGFGEWVSRSASLSEVAVHGPVAGLDVITVGNCDPREVSELLDLRFPELLRAARQAYDVVVLDTAPLLCTPESLALSRLADGVVLSVMRDVSRLSSIQACAERLASINARVLGAVVTGATPESTAGY